MEQERGSSGISECGGTGGRRRDGDGDSRVGESRVGREGDRARSWPSRAIRCGGIERGCRGRRAGAAVGAAAVRGGSGDRADALSARGRGQCGRGPAAAGASGAAPSSVRTVQRAVAPVRQAQRAADVATVRVETAPGAQMQIDFGEKRVTDRGHRHHGLSAGRGAQLLATHLRESISPRAPGRLARGHRRGLHALRRRRVDRARRQRPRAGARARSGDRHRDIPSRLPGLLSRLGRAAARLRAVSRAHQGQGRVRREVREAQRAGGPHLRVVCRARAASGAVDGRGRSARARHDARAAVRSLRPRGAGRASSIAGASAAASGAATAPTRGQRCLRRRRDGALQRAVSARARSRRGRD